MLSNNSAPTLNDIQQYEFLLMLMSLQTYCRSADLTKAQLGDFASIQALKANLSVATVFVDQAEGAAETQETPSQ